MSMSWPSAVACSVVKSSVVDGGLAFPACVCRMLAQTHNYNVNKGALAAS